MKKKFSFSFLLVLYLSFSFSLFAQVSTDPNHEFYKSIQKWKVQGMVKNVPPLRPYPLNVVKDLLLQVLDNDELLEKERLVAEEYWQEFTGKPFRLYVEAVENFCSENNDNGIGTNLFGAVEGDANFIKDFVSAGYRIGFNGYTKKATDYFSTFNPHYSGLPYDTVQDPGKIGPLYGYFNSNENFAVGNKNYFFQAGVNRIGYGDFIQQGIALNENSYHCANTVLTVLNDRWNYSQIYCSIGATRGFDGDDLNPNKYLAFHQTEFFLTQKITLAYYESIIYGNRFDFSYFIPSPYMATQGLGGCNDNLQMGIRFDYTPVKNLLWANDLYVDDVSFNDLVKFDFDTKIRVSAITGLQYYFENKYLDCIKMNYALVTPYTYSHWDYTDSRIDSIKENVISYQNYTNNGIPIGSTIPPNSDAINLSFVCSPMKNLKINLDFGFIRHGNSAETLPVDEAVAYVLSDRNIYATDGSIYHHVFYPNPRLNEENYNPDYTDYLPSAWNTLNFLNQEHKMYVFQGGISATYCMKNSKFGKLNLKFGYKAEYIKNKGVDSHLLPGGKVIGYDKDGKVVNNLLENKDKISIYEYNGKKIASDELLIQQFKKDWVANFVDVFNNYFYIGFDWKF